MSAATSMPSRRPGWLFPVLIGATVLGAGEVIFDLAAMMMSPMMFDSGESRAAWAAFTAIWTMPLVVILGLLLGWIGYARHGTRLATAGIVLLVLPLVAVALVFAGALAG